MKRVEGREVICKDGRRGTLGSVIKHRKGWEYFVHLTDGSVELMMRADFQYVK